MTSHEPEGAVDKSFDDAERDARSILQENVDAFPSDIRRGDVVIDLVKNRPLYVWRVAAETAVDYFDSNDFDLTTYKAHPFLPVSPDDTIFECAFLPTTVEDIRTSAGAKSYDYPRGRLARVPVEYYFDSERHREDTFTDETLSRLFASTDGPAAQAVANVAVNVFGEDRTRGALEAAGHDPDGFEADVVIDYADVDPDTGTPRGESESDGDGISTVVTQDTDDGELVDFEPTGASE